MTGYAADEEEGLRLLVQNQDLLYATTRQGQIAIAGKYLLRSLGGRGMTFESTARFFGVRTVIIQAQIELVKSSFGAPGRQVSLSAAAKEWLENPIRTRFEEWKPITYEAVLDSLQYDRQVVITADALRHIIQHMELVKTIIVQPMEVKRVAVDPDEISAWLEGFKYIVDSFPREFLFNMDEIGCSDHSDSREVRVIVPIDYGEPSVIAAFDRHSKRSTFMACIAADGFRMKPFAIVDCVTAEKELQYYDYDTSNVTLTSGQRLYDGCTFYIVGNDCFLPYDQTMPYRSRI
jgi:hypothetical protein